MKKLIFILVFLIGICSAYAGEKTYSLTLNAGLRNITGINDENGNNLYEEVYGKNNLIYGIDIGYNFGKFFQAFLHGEFFTAKGELSFSKEETTLTIIPLEIGARVKYMLGRQMFYPYFGVGAGYYLYKEENLIGTVDDGQFGFFTEGGINVYFLDYLFLDLKMKYIIFKVDGVNEKVDLGGLALMGGIGFSF
jgi:hypothetical protein